MMSSRSTSDGRYDWYATSKKTVHVPTRNPTANNCASVSDIGDVGGGDREEQNGAPEVAGDEDRAPPEPVDPDAGRKREEDERQELERAESRDFEG